MQGLNRMNQDMNQDNDQPVISGRWAFLTWAIVTEGALLVVALIGCRLFNQPVSASLNWLDLALSIFVTGALLLLFLILLRASAAPFRRIREILERVLLPLMRNCHWLELAAISIAAGVGEEWLFRGFLQGELASHLGGVPAIVLASIVFGFCHYITRTYFILATVLGAIFGWLYFATNNLLTVIVIHSLYDFIALLILQREYRK
jgi:membrane protease YdiL (CAAX protease family)